MPTLKTILRNALPARAQVPVKYLYGMLRGEMEEEMALLPLLIARGDHAVDVGGNRGTYSYRLWRIGARVDVFEPNPGCAAVLRGWAAGKPVTVHDVALSSAAGSAQLHVPVDEHGVEHDASASIGDQLAPGSRDIPVELRSLDSFGFTDLALIKIDVEGHETGVIEGAVGTIAASQPALIVEIEQRHNARPIREVFGQIGSLGYRGFFLEHGRLVPIEEFDPARHQSMTAFGTRPADYHNNFLFLATGKLAAGVYARLAERWMTER